MSWLKTRLRQAFDPARIALPSVVLVVILLAAVGLSEWVRGVDLAALLACGTFGVLVTWRQAGRTKQGWSFWLLLSAAGVLLSVLFVRELGGAVLSWLGDLLRLIPGLIQARSLAGLSQLEPASVELTFAVQVFFNQLSGWWQELLAGDAGYFPQVNVLIWNFVIWAMAAWLTWAVGRAFNPFAAILPLILVLTTIVAYTKTKTWVLGLVLAAGLGLVAYVQHYQRERRWEQQSISYSLEIRIDIFLLAVLVSGSILFLTLTVPSLSIRKIVDAFQEIFSNEQQVEIAPAVGLFEAPTRAQPEPAAALGIMPADQLIGSPPDLGETLVMHVTPEGAFLAEVSDQPYWRSHSLETYTGQGWLAGPVEAVLVQPGNTLETPLLGEGRRYHFYFAQLPTDNQTLYFPGALRSADAAFEALFRITSGKSARTDFYAATADARQYQVEVTWPVYHVEDLLTSSEDYPEWVLSRYLQLPDDLPLRVTLLAEQITSNEASAYLKAAAIERYLRHFPYSLEVPSQPPDRDVVDYFLFDLQEGYCDYYASAMVVLARAVGLPARLVVGYAAGEFIQERGYYQVTEAEAHTWVEVYFPEYGWVPFEPTSSQEVFSREVAPGADLETETPFSFPSGAGVIWRQVRVWLIISLLAVPVLAAAGLGIDSLRLQALPQEEMAKRLYARLTRFAVRAQVPVEAGATPYEFSRAVRKYLTDMWCRSLPAGKASAALDSNIESLVHYCVLAVYGENLIQRQDQRRIAAAWRRLLPWLVLSLLGNRLRPASSVQHKTD